MNTCKIAFYNLQNVAKIRNSTVSLRTKLRYLYMHLFHPSWIFCNALLYDSPQSVLDRLQHVQPCADRLVFRTRSSERITPVLSELHWLPIRQRITSKILLLTYKALNGMAPKYIVDLLHRYAPTRLKIFFKKSSCNTEVYSQVLWRQIFSSCCTQTLERTT